MLWIVDTLIKTLSFLIEEVKQTNKSNVYFTGRDQILQDGYHFFAWNSSSGSYQKI